MDSSAELAARLAQLSPEARALLARRLSARRGHGGPTIPRRDPGRPAPISYAQWRLWFMEQLRPGTNAWNTPVAARLRGPLDDEVLRASLAMVVDRHATLRTVFESRAGQPVPVVVEAPEVTLPVLEGEDAAVEGFVAGEVARPFRLESDVMVRARLLRLGAEDHVLVLVAHHIACDGWSKGLLLRELCTAYDALSAGAQPELPELPLQYADFAAWQREELSGENLGRLMEFWAAELSGHALALELPTDRPRPPRQAFQGATCRLEVPGALADRTRALGRQERATAFMTLLAAFNGFLHAHSAQRDLLVGSPSAMRTHPELEHVIGLFANTLVYRTSVAGEPSFRELIGRVRDAAVRVYAHQELPFEKIVEALNPRRDPSRSPLVQVNMRVEGREPALRFRGIDAEPIPLDPGIARFDLAIELGEIDEGYEGYLEYDTALFDAGSAAAFARDFVAILEAVVAKPDEPLTALEAVRAIGARRCAG